jgi:methylthioribose-1-phosphate isomerase
MYKKDKEDNKNISLFGSSHLITQTNKEKLRVMTHCNTGALATCKFKHKIEVNMEQH